MDIPSVASRALAHSEVIVSRLLPHGRRVGQEWIATNPRRNDRRPGSFKVNMTTGQWSDFASGDAGGDLVSLQAYLDGTNQGEAAKRVAELVGVDTADKQLRHEPKPQTVAATNCC